MRPATSAFSGRAENICSPRVFRLLTLSGHRERLGVMYHPTAGGNQRECGHAMEDRTDTCPRRGRDHEYQQGQCAKPRRFLTNYLKADETGSLTFIVPWKRYRSSAIGLPPPELGDTEIAEFTSSSAMKIVLVRSRLKQKTRLLILLPMLMPQSPLPTIAQQAFTLWIKRCSN
jgi:hypothetical protein